MTKQNVRHPVILVCTVMLMAVFNTNVFALDIGGGNNFLDYGNGAINLNNVTHITPVVNYRVTLPGDDAEDMFDEFSARPPHRIPENVMPWLEPEEWQSLPYYYYEISSSITFDAFELTTVSEQNFIKLPMNQEELLKVQDKEKFSVFLKGIEKQIRYRDLGRELSLYFSLLGGGQSDSEEIALFDDKYLELANTFPALSIEAVESIKRDLRRHMELYDKATK